MCGEYANSLDLVNRVSDLCSAGVRIPEQVEKLVRPDSLLGSASQVANSLPSESQAANWLPSCAQSAQVSRAPNHPAPSVASRSSHGLFIRLAFLAQLLIEIVPLVLRNLRRGCLSRYLR